MSQIAEHLDTLLPANSKAVIGNSIRLWDTDKYQLLLTPEAYSISAREDVLPLDAAELLSHASRKEWLLRLEGRVLPALCSGLTLCNYLVDGSTEPRRALRTGAGLLIDLNEDVGVSLMDMFSTHVAGRLVIAQSNGENLFILQDAQLLGVEEN